MQPEERKKIKRQMKAEKAEVDLTFQEIQQVNEKLRELREERRANEKAEIYHSRKKIEAGVDYDLARSHGRAGSQLTSSSLSIYGQISQAEEERAQLWEKHNQAKARYRALRGQLEEK